MSVETSGAGAGVRPLVSIIINTDGRAKSLAITLASLRHLDYPAFEVCVVYGPTEDGTRELLDLWRDDVKIAHCPTRNLSQSRNIGLALAAGEFVAFLDDDSIPETEWLTKVVAPFADADVAACGGFLVDHTGVAYQWRFGTANRMGMADVTWQRPAPELNYPYTANFPHVMANSAFRLSAVLAVGGFDEQYIYFLDETDLICRLVDRGYRIVQLAGAPVHHKYAASHIRTEGRLLTAWYAIVRSKIYFSLVNANGHHGVVAAIRDAQAFVADFEHVLEWAIGCGKLSAELRASFRDDIDRAFRSGLAEGLAAKRLFYQASALAHYAQPFRPFGIRVPSGLRRTICLFTQTYPPASVGGIGRYVHQLARSLAHLGHQIHVLTRSSDIDTVDWEDGVWVHRLRPRPNSRDHAEAEALPIPQHLWDYSATMLSEVRKIAVERTVDVVYAPVWDGEGIAVLLDGEFRLVTSLQTTLAFWLDSHAHMCQDDVFMESFVTPMLAVERHLLQRSHGIHAISAAIAHEIEVRYEVDFAGADMAVVPLGQEDWTRQPSILPDTLPDGTLRLLFVGRLERRKGVDVLLDVLPQLMRSHDNLYVDLVGNDSLTGAEGATYRHLFEARHAGEPWLSRVRFHGEVDEQRLRGFYHACDIFAAPSRFESFGLILLEAMMYGKPVIGCRAGGMGEVVVDGVSGLLAEPGDSASLADAIEALLHSRQLRVAMGAAARARYEQAFSPERMATGVLDFLVQVADWSLRSEKTLLGIDQAHADVS